MSFIQLIYSLYIIPERDEYPCHAKQWPTPHKSICSLHILASTSFITLYIIPSASLIPFSYSAPPRCIPATLAQHVMTTTRRTRHVPFYNFVPPTHHISDWLRVDWLVLFVRLGVTYI